MSQKSLDRIPRPLIFGVAGLVIASLVGVTALRATGVDPLNAARSQSSAAAEISVIIAPVKGGGTELLDPVTGGVVASLAVGADGFVRGVLRALDHVRDRSGVPHDTPVTLAAWADGHLALVDPATNWRVELVGFGPDNRDVFAMLMSDAADRREDIR